MLQYTSNEGSNSSHFFITTPQDNICILAFKKLDVEDTDFNNDFLQNNIMEMVVAKAGNIPENYCKELAHTIKVLFDRTLEEKRDLIIYVCVDAEKYKSLKYQLIKRYVNDDCNDHFNFLSFKVDDKVFIFFVNSKKTNSIKAYVDLANYFELEYGIEFEEEL